MLRSAHTGAGAAVFKRPLPAAVVPPCFPDRFDLYLPPRGIAHAESCNFFTRSSTARCVYAVASSIGGGPWSRFPGMTESCVRLRQQCPHRREAPRASQSDCALSKRCFDQSCQAPQLGSSEAFPAAENVAAALLHIISPALCRRSHVARPSPARLNFTQIHQ
jgi:hypothetical protein